MRVRSKHTSRSHAAAPSLVVCAMATLAASVTSCRRPQPAAMRDAGLPQRATDRDATTVATPSDAPAPPPYDAPSAGPPDPFSEGGLPPSTATGPEADVTRAVLAALRASIGFWRTENNTRDRCPTFDDLRRTPGAAFDPTNMARDPWGTPFEIQCLGARVLLRSAGPDRTPDTPDDIWSR